MFFLNKIIYKHKFPLQFIKKEEKMKETNNNKQFYSEKIGKLLQSSSKKAGKPPGSLVYVGKEKENNKAVIEIMDYSPSKLTEHKTNNVEEVFKYRDTKTVSWLNVTGIHDKDTIKKIGDQYFRF